TVFLAAHGLADGAKQTVVGLVHALARPGKGPQASADPGHVVPLKAARHGRVKMRACRRNRRFRLTAWAEFRSQVTGIRPDAIEGGIKAEACRSFTSVSNCIQWRLHRIDGG